MIASLVGCPLRAWLQPLTCVSKLSSQRARKFHARSTGSNGSNGSNGCNGCNGCRTSARGRKVCSVLGARCSVLGQSCQRFSKAARRSRGRFVGKWASGQVGKWASGQVGKWASGQVGKWASGCLCSLPARVRAPCGSGMTKGHTLSDVPLWSSVRSEDARCDLVVTNPRG
jgi:hypothetical protein